MDETARSESSRGTSWIGEGLILATISVGTLGLVAAFEMGYAQSLGIPLAFVSVSFGQILGSAAYFATSFVGLFGCLALVVTSDRHRLKRWPAVLMWLSCGCLGAATTAMTVFQTTYSRLSIFATAGCMAGSLLFFNLAIPASRIWRRSVGGQATGGGELVAPQEAARKILHPLNIAICYYWERCSFDTGVAIA
jgi:hypothetical protein